MLRSIQGYSQESYAHHAGLDLGYMGSIERGEHNLAILNLVKIEGRLMYQRASYLRGLNRMDYKDFDLKNHECIAEFLRSTQNSTCDISGSVKATIAQFLMNFRIEINKRASALGQNWLSPIDIIDSQVCELRRCVIDLEAYKERLKKGVIAQ